MTEKKQEPELPPSGVSRRFFLKAVSGAGLGTVALSENGLVGAPAVKPKDETGAPSEPAGLPVLKGEVPIELTVNGRRQALKVEPRITLLDALRDRLDLTGTKVVCDRGACGACTVYLDGKPVNSCMVLAVDAVGRDITTIEALASEDGDLVKLDPVQAAFLECDALQCGFCTPGFVMAIRAVLDANPRASLEEVKEGIAGNLCRCGTYNHIFAAVERARALVADQAKG